MPPRCVASADAIDRNKSSPFGQLERYYQANEQLHKAMGKHWATEVVALEAERDAYKALVALREAELAALA